MEEGHRWTGNVLEEDESSMKMKNRVSCLISVLLPVSLIHCRVYKLNNKLLLLFDNEVQI